MIFFFLLNHLYQLSTSITFLAPAWTAEYQQTTSSDQDRTLLSRPLSHHKELEGTLPLSCPRMREYMLRRPNTFRKYQEAELTLNTETDTRVTSG